MEAMRQSWSDDRLDDLQLEMRAGFARLETLIEQQGAEMNRRFEEVARRFVEVDRRFDEVDRKFELVDKRFEQIDKRFEHVDGRFEHMDTRFAQVATGIGRVDGRIDSQARAIVYLATVLSTIVVALLASRFFG
jgi:CII-binding regulator of phage lambda lysogenization HflD